MSSSRILTNPKIADVLTPFEFILGFFRKA